MVAEVARQLQFGCVFLLMYNEGGGIPTNKIVDSFIQKILEESNLTPDQRLVVSVARTQMRLFRLFYLSSHVHVKDDRETLRERHTQRERHIDKERQTNRLTNAQREREIDRNRHTHTHKERDTQIKIDTGCFTHVDPFEIQNLGSKNLKKL